MSNTQTTRSATVQEENGPRAAKLREVMKRALDASVHAVKSKHIDKAFPSLAKDHSTTLSELWNQFMEQLKRAIEEEFLAICDEHQVIKQLNQLDASEERIKILENDHGEAPKVEPDAAGVSRRAGDTVTRQRQAEVKLLREVVAQLKKRDTLLEEEVAAMQKEAEQIQKDIESAANALDKVADKAEEAVTD